MASQHHPPGETTVKVIELRCERPTLTVRTPHGNEGVLPVLPTVMLTDPPTVTVDRPASPILQAGTAKVIFEVQSTGELRVTGNAWTDAQVFNPGEAIEFRVGRPSRQVQAFRRGSPLHDPYPGGSTAGATKSLPGVHGDPGVTTPTTSPKSGEWPNRCEFCRP